MIVDAGAKQPEAVAVLHAGDHEIAVVQIDIEIFDLGAPVRCETEFGTQAGGPARIGMRLRQAKGLAAQFAEGEARRPINQDVIESIAGTPAHRAEPWIGEFPRRKGVGSAGGLKVTFDAEYPGAGLEIIAGLRAADEARGPGRIVVDGAPRPAEIAAEIRTGPAVHVERLTDGVRRPRPIGQIGGLRRRGPDRGDQSHRSDRNLVHHSTLPNTCRDRWLHATNGALVTGTVTGLRSLPTGFIESFKLKRC